MEIIMKNFKVKIYSDPNEGEYDFECYENTEHINQGDYFLFYFAGIYDIGKCESDKEEYEVNKNDRTPDLNKIDLVTGFWTNCYKIKSTNFDYKLLDI